jgi:hypothetical protein
MGAPAYRKVFKLEGSTKNCAEAAWRLLNNPNVARIIESKRRQLARIQDGAFEQLQASEERIIEAIAALAFYDPRDVVQWGPDGAVFSVSSDLPLRSVLAIKEISYIQGRGIRIRFHDRRAALMDLARLRGMITDKSATYHFHEELARMSPDDPKRRVAELLEFAASIRVPGDSAIDVTPDEDTDE